MRLNVSLRHLVIGGAIVFQCARSAHAQIPSDEINGVWEGSVSVVGVIPDTNRDGFRLGDSIRLRIEFFPDRERVSVTSPDFPEAQMIHIGQVHSSAIILGVMRASDRTENWALTVSLHDERRMLVALSRGVTPMQNADGAVVAVGALGQLQQVDDD